MPKNINNYTQRRLERSKYSRTEVASFIGAAALAMSATYLLAGPSAEVMDVIVNKINVEVTEVDVELARAKAEKEKFDDSAGETLSNH